MVKELALADFSGGFVDRRASTTFSEGEWARIKGFVLEDSRRLRSQWALQKVAGVTGVKHLGVYEGHSNDFLVAVKTDGSIVWCVAPAADLASAAAGMTPTWNALANVDASTPTNSGDVSMRQPICTIPLRQASTAGFRSGLLLNSITLADGSASVVVYENDAGGTLRFVESTDHWPADATEEVIPKAEVGTMWNGVLVLGDIEWKHDGSLALSSSNKKRHRNALLLSEPALPFQFDPDSVILAEVGDGESRIAGLFVLDAGLLILTENGVYLLRGTPADFTLETVREGVGSVVHGGHLWSDTGTVSWVSPEGQVWQSNGRSVIRLDWQGLGFDDRAAEGDSCRGFGPSLLTHREDRVLTLRAFEDSENAAWTELALGTVDDVDFRHGGVLEDCFYFVAGGEVWRWSVPQRAGGVSERGSGTQGALELQIATPTLQGEGGHRKTFWHGVGVRASAGSDDPDSAVLVDVEMHAGPALDSTAPTLVRTSNLNLAPAAERLRGDAQFRGIGPSREFAATVTFEGDVEVEQVTVFFDDGHKSGSTEGV